VTRGTGHRGAWDAPGRRRVGLRRWLLLAAYILLGGAWLLVSNRVLASWVPDPALLPLSQAAAGLLFILATSAVLYCFVRRLLSARDESRRMLGTLLRNVPGMAYRCQNSPGWPMQFVSEGSLALTGYLPSQLTDGTLAGFQELIHPDDRDAVWTHVQTAVGRGDAYHLTYRLRTATGEEKWVWEQGRAVYRPDGGVVALEGYITDLTDQVLAQQASDVQAQERSDELATLLEVSRHVAGTLELEPLLGQILQQLQTVVAYDSAAILRTGAGDHLSVQAYRGPLPAEQALNLRLPANRAYFQRVIQHQEPVIIPDVQDDTPWAQEYRAALDSPEAIRCWMGIPLIIRGQTVGMLSLGHHDPHYYSAHHQRLVRSFAIDVGLAIDNAELYEDSRRRVAEIESLQRITTALLEKLKLHEVLDIVYLEACQLTTATGCALFFWDGGSAMDVAQSGGALRVGSSQVPVTRSFAGRAVLSGRPVIVHDAQELAGATDLPPGVETMLAMPLRVQGATVGALNVANKPGGFTPEDVRILSLFADAAALALENARLNEKVGQIAVVEERQRLARELHDSVTQALYTIALYAEASRLALSTGKVSVATENLAELHATAREAMLDMRRLIFELRPPLLAEEGLASALQARLAAVEARAGLTSQLEVEGERRPLLPVDTELFWIAVEALNNVVKHARASRLVVRLVYDEQAVQLEVRDDGRGFDLESIGEGGGVGLRGIEERVQRINGQWEIHSKPGEGTSVRVVVRY
jgi:signal transduction histidine kinase/PAS domain-containing protein